MSPKSNDAPPEKFWKWVYIAIKFWLKIHLTLTLLGLPLLSWIHHGTWEWIEWRKNLELMKFSFPLVMIWAIAYWILIKLKIFKKPD